MNEIKFDHNNKEELFSKASCLYDDGKYEEAFHLFKALADFGNVIAMTRVACMYGEGKGVNYDIEESIKWDISAAELGESTALFNLGATYRNIGDFRQSKRWFEKALEHGDGEAAIELAKMYLISDLEINRVKNYLLLALSNLNLCESSRNEANRLLLELQGRKADSAR